MKTRNKTSSTESSALDDASTLESASGGSPLVHGIAVDTIARSIPTNTVPLFVRESLFRAWPGMNGNVVNSARNPSLNALSPLIPWYSYDTNGNQLVDSVAERLTVSTSDAENWSQHGLGRFGRYADLPMNEATFARHAFWRYDPEANEFDTSMMLEPQVYAHDALSQLFTECCTFHFGYLADVDAEYHRLRSGGVVAQYDEDAIEYEPWYRLYHYWRLQIYNAYLGGDGNPVRIRLPQHLLNGNWSIADVLSELEARLEGSPGYIHNDMIVTGKGYMRGSSTVTLGLQSDAKYLDGDGNPRFYHPYAQRASTAEMRVMSPGVTLIAGAQGGELISGQSAISQGVSGNVSATTELDELSVGGIWSAYNQLLLSQPGGSLPNWNIELNLAIDASGASPVDFYGDSANVGRVYTGFNGIHDLPYNGVLSVDGVDYNYWTGHCLNLFEFIEFMRHVGQSTEPEVLDKLLVPMGVVVSCDAFKQRPSAASASHLDELYNLYESQSSFNENPARKFTAAHLGPTAHVIPSDQTDPRSLSLRGNRLSTEQDGQLLTARERYWTPGSLTADQAQQVASAFLPGVVLKTILYPNLDIEALASTDDNTLREFLSRALGTVGSMRTKVEKPVFLQAGKTGPESTFASGVGVGALQLVYEILHSMCGGKPRFGLGYGGFSDISMAAGEAATPGALIPWNITTRAQVLDETNSIATFSEASDFNSLIDALSALRYPGPLDILSTTHSDMITDAILDNKYKAANLFINSDGRSLLASQGLTTGLFGDSRASAVTPSHFSSIGRGAAGISVSSQNYTLPHSMCWGVPTFHTSSPIREGRLVAGMHIARIPNAQAQLGPFAHHSSQHVAQLDPSEGAAIAIYALPEIITMYDIATGNSLGSHDLIGDDPFALQTGANLENRPALISGRTIVPVTAPRDHAEETAGYTNMGNLYSNGVGGGFAFNFPFSYDSLQPERLLGAPFKYFVPEYQPADMVRIFGGDLWSQYKLANPNSTLSITDVGFNLDVGVYYVDANPTNDPAIVDFGGSFCEGVRRLGHSTWDLVIEDRDADRPAVTRDMIGVSVTGTYTPAYVSQERQVALTETIDLSSGSHVRFLSSNWTEDPDSVQYRATSGYVMTTTDHLTDWTLPLGSGVNNGFIDYSLWQAFTSPLDHPVSRTLGLWSSLDILVDTPSIHAPSTDLTNFLSPTVGSGPWSGSSFKYGMFLNRDITNEGETYTDSAGTTFEFSSSLAPAVSTAYSTPTSPLITFDFNRQVGDLQVFPGPSAEHSGMTDSIALSNLVFTHMATRGQGTLNVFADESLSCATYVFPDLPTYKMRFRPYRRIADATLMMEQKLTFMNDGEDPSPLAGPLGIKVIGTPSQFRFADLVDAGQPETYLLEPVRSKTRLIDPSHRSVLTFTKLALLDEDSQTHTIPDVIMEENQKAISKGNVHASGAGGSSKVYSRKVIRDIQLGRQFQRM